MLKKEWNDIFDYYREEKTMTQSELVIAVLTELQAIEGCIPKEAREAAAELAGVNPGYVSAVIKRLPHLHEQSFRHEIKVCISDRCKNKGGQDVLKEIQRILKIRPGQVTRDKRFLLTTVYCMHYCTKGPNVQIDGRLFQNVTAAEVPSILKKYS
ncbi:NADH-quinone oxidoreductase subunit NuoE family protein [[Clostridium] hylemonae]|uniref:NADH-quinone oxidoreductase subunit NuoE family protein n=1 Tax=[Clostridium] hylemonae TaxID=89153 RepID=UPI001FCB9842|nr:NAD(P)H-dependent oxidoreductase subunit E [[Clostridium] hylemonae]BDF05769.1 NADH dehydrogenase [[Clostridium] hylemonae]